MFSPSSVPVVLVTLPGSTDAADPPAPALAAQSSSTPVPGQAHTSSDGPTQVTAPLVPPLPSASSGFAWASFATVPVDSSDGDGHPKAASSSESDRGSFQGAWVPVGPSATATSSGTSLWGADTSATAADTMWLEAGPTGWVDPFVPVAASRATPPISGITPMPISPATVVPSPALPSSMYSSSLHVEDPFANYAPVGASVTPPVTLAHLRASEPSLSHQFAPRSGSADLFSSRAAMRYGSDVGLGPNTNTGGSPVSTTSQADSVPSPATSLAAPPGSGELAGSGTSSPLRQGPRLPPPYYSLGLFVDSVDLSFWIFSPIPSCCPPLATTQHRRDVLYSRFRVRFFRRLHCRVSCAAQQRCIQRTIKPSSRLSFSIQL